MQYNKEELAKAIEQSHDEVAFYLGNNGYSIDISMPDDDGDIMITTYSKTLRKKIIMGYVKDNDTDYEGTPEEIKERLEDLADVLIACNEEAIALLEKYNLN